MRLNPTILGICSPARALIGLPMPLPPNRPSKLPFADIVPSLAFELDAAPHMIDEPKPVIPMDEEKPATKTTMRTYYLDPSTGKVSKTAIPGAQKIRGASIADAQERADKL